MILAMAFHWTEPRSRKKLRGDWWPIEMQIIDPQQPDAAWSIDAHYARPMISTGDVIELWQIDGPSIQFYQDRCHPALETAKGGLP